MHLSISRELLVRSSICTGGEKGCKEKEVQIGNLGMGQRNHKAPFLTRTGLRASQSVHCTDATYQPSLYTS